MLKFDLHKLLLNNLKCSDKKRTIGNYNLFHFMREMDIKIPF